ncbi:MAG: hypothetical protein NTU54_01645 [Candidatus Omnitrophica bacterium]|nr:hypothetical protein [Candidatus Omnitrophota bacterium]
MIKARVLPTGIGSLPCVDANQALDLVFKYCPQVPFWPQLPKRDPREGMVAQFSENLPCIRMSRNGVFFDPQRKENELEVFYAHIIENDTDHFKITPDFARGLHSFYERLEKSDYPDIEFIKCHVTGPFTFAAGIQDEAGKALLHDTVFMQAITKGLGMKALWQIKTFRKFGKKIILFFDEPYLGCFGSGFTPITRETVVSVLEEFTAAIRSEDVYIGVHCCGNTDWSIFTDVPGIDIINFDAFSYQDKFVLYADDLKGFLQRGGIICWGVVPTQEFDGSQTPELLVERIEEGFKRLIAHGVKRELLTEGLMLSPACGLGTLDAAKAKGIFKLLSQTSEFIKKHF